MKGERPEDRLIYRMTHTATGHTIGLGTPWLLQTSNKLLSEIRFHVVPEIDVEADLEDALWGQVICRYFILNLEA